MSPLWRDHVRLGLGKDALVVAGYRRGVRPRFAHKQIIAVAAAEAHDWQASVEASSSALLACRFHCPDVSVVLSNCWVRYVLLPWNPAIRRPSEWLALARHRMAAVYGQAVEAWEVRVIETRHGGARIACGIDSALLDALPAKVAEGHARLRSVQPYLVTAFNRIRPQIGHQSCWLVIEEPGCVVLARIGQGTWRSIRTRVVDQTWRATFPEMLERESALLALGEPCSNVVIYAAHPFEVDPRSGYQLRDLTLAGGNMPGDQPLAMALA